MKPAIKFEENELLLLDQRKLPQEETYLRYERPGPVASAISDMVVRGAPAIGITAAYAMALAARGHGNDDQILRQEKKKDILSAMEEAADRLRRARPTASNLFWAVDRMLNKARSLLAGDEVTGAYLAEAMLKEADKIHRQDVEQNRKMGQYGAQLVEEGDSILTHCNAGALATGGYGTALGVIRAAAERHDSIDVYVDETRPRLQGARLTAWELQQEDIPFTLITDNQAGWLMRSQEIDVVFVGADRIAANGDVANKIGTYTLACLAQRHGIPFYVAAPGSTIDLGLSCGDEIELEERDATEVTYIGGQCIAPQGAKAKNVAFDVTPHHMVTAIITEKGTIHRPYRRQLSAEFAQ